VAASLFSARQMPEKTQERERKKEKGSATKNADAQVASKTLASLGGAPKLKGPEDF